MPSDEVYLDLLNRGTSSAATLARATRSAVATRDAIAAFQREMGLRVTGELDEPTRAALEKRRAAMEGKGITVEGRLATSARIPAPGVLLAVLAFDLGADATEVARATTDEDGYFTLRIEREPPLLVQFKVRSTVDREGTWTVLAEPETLRERHVVRDLVLPKNSEPVVGDEYSRLVAALAAVLGDTKLESLEASETRRDVSVAAERAGWDVRLVALAVIAAQEAHAQGVDARVEYAILRAGIPVDPGELAKIPVARLKVVLEKAVSSRIVALSAADIEVGLRALQTVVAQYAPSLPALGRTSTIYELLASTRLSEQEQNQLLNIHIEHGTDSEGFAKAMQEKLPNAVPAVALSGKLAYLTQNNARLMDHVRELAALTSENDLGKLADLGLYSAAAWKAELVKVGGNEPAAILPDTYEMDGTAARMDAYAADLAAMVKRNFPTRTLARQVEQKEVVNLGNRAPAVATVLRAASNLGVEIGGPSTGRLSTFFRTHGPTLVPDEAERAEVKRELLTLQRLHQITPSDEAMTALHNAGLHSSRAITQIDLPTFKKRTGLADDDADLVYAKAQQVVVTADFVLSSAKAAGSPTASPMVMTPQDPAAAANAAKATVAAQSPSLESLFSSMDVCPCDSCQSILSPAAYFVDLLRFLDPDDASWKARTDEWAAKHGAPYPSSLTPFGELLARRPDLPHIPLTCENTFTELPQIDVVNEILEVFVAGNGALNGTAAHDTGAAESADLIAEPASVLDAAYVKLEGTIQPPPFDLARERVRAFLERFDTSWATVLEAFQSDPANADATSAAILESIGVGPKELAPFLVPPSSWATLYDFTPGAASASLFDGTDKVMAKTLARLLGISQIDLVDHVRSRFVNPKLNQLVYLRKAGLTAEDALAFKANDPADAAANQAFAQKLEDLTTAFPGFVWSSSDFDQVLVLHNSTGSCLFDDVRLQFVAPGGDLTAVLHRLAIMVRLERKLGWSRDEVDLLLSTGFPLEEATYAAGMRAKLVHAASVAELATRLGVSREAALLLFADLPTTGANPLYNRLFLRKSVLETDRAFEDANGAALDGAELVSAHVPALQAGLGLTATDVAAVAGANYATTKLTLGFVSGAHQIATLAKALALAPREIIELLELTGARDVDATPPRWALPQAPSTLPTTDAALGARKFGLALLEDIRTLGALGFSGDVLRRLLGATARQDAGHANALIVALAADLARVDADAALSATDLLTAEALRAKLSLVVKPDVVDVFLGMWSGAFEGGAKSAVDLDPKAFAKDARFTLKDARHVRFRGVATPAVAAGLKAAFPGAAEASVIDILASQVGKFLAGDIALLFGGADLEMLFPATRTPAALAAQSDLTRDILAPRLRDALTQRTLVDALVKATGADAAFLRAVVHDAKVLEGPSGGTLASALVLARNRGAIATFTAASGTTTRRVDGIEALAIPAGTTEVRFDGVFPGPPGGTLTLTLNLGAAGAVPDLRVDGKSVAIATAGGTSVDVTLLDLGPGLHDFSLSIAGVGAAASATVEDAAGATSVLSSVVDLESANAIRAAFIRLSSALDLAGLAALDAADLTTVLAGTALALPFAPIPRPAQRALFARLRTIVRYARLKRELGGRDRARSALRSASVAELAATLGAALPRDVASIASLVNRFFASLAAGAPPTVDQLLRLLSTLRVARKVRASVADIGKWVDGAVDLTMTRQLRDTLRSAVSEASWRAFAKPVFDGLRQKQRDALVSWALLSLGLTRTEQLFEHLLLDPGTQPVVLTSRIQLAISSVQTFIQRIFLGLEEAPVPADILDAKQWAWLGRYRVSEANKKILIWTANWLDPELRDDATHLMKGALDTLFQSDVTPDTAEAVFSTYLQGLEEIARLEIVSYEEDAQGVLHVLARTYGNPRKHFYRTRRGSMWDPWIPISTNITSDHVVLVVWHDRVHVLWVTFLDRHNLGDLENSSSIATMSTSTSPKEMSSEPTRDVQLSWVEYFQGKWGAQRTSDIVPGTKNMYPANTTMDVIVDGASLTINLTSNGEALQLIVANKSMAVEPTLQPNFELKFPVSFDGKSGVAGRFVGPSPMSASFDTGSGVAEHTVLAAMYGHGQGVLPARVRSVKEPLRAPFFMQDARHTFFVTPTLTESTLQAWGDWVVVKAPNVVLADALAPSLQPKIELFDPARDPLEAKAADWLTDGGVGVRVGSIVVGGRAGAPTLERTGLRTGKMG